MLHDAISAFGPVHFRLGSSGYADSPPIQVLSRLLVPAPQVEEQNDQVLQELQAIFKIR